MNLTLAMVIGFQSVFPRPRYRYNSDQTPVPMLLQDLQSIHCPSKYASNSSIMLYCFLCALGPISLLKAKYDTSRLRRALMPTSRIRNSGMMAAKAMNSPGVKY